jgi:hypothetical protein
MRLHILQSYLISYLIYISSYLILLSHLIAYLITTCTHVSTLRNNHCLTRHFHRRVLVAHCTTCQSRPIHRLDMSATTKTMMTCDDNLRHRPFFNHHPPTTSQLFPKMTRNTKKGRRDVINISWALLVQCVYFFNLCSSSYIYEMLLHHHHIHQRQPNHKKNRHDISFFFCCHFSFTY